MDTEPQTLTSPGHDEHYAIRDAINGALRAVRQNAPQSRERSIVITHLETALLWAGATRLNGQVDRPPAND